MTTTDSTASLSTTPATSAPWNARLLRLYLARFVVAVLWAGILILTSATPGPLVTVLLIVYPLVDAGAVWWQLRSPHRTAPARTSEWVNIVVSIVVAIALGVSSTFSFAAALAIWGAWAIGSGIPQLITAIRNRRSGGQVAQMLSGGISVLAGSAFLSQGLRGVEDIGMVGGYAILGGVFFLISAIRLAMLRRSAA